MNTSNSKIYKNFVERGIADYETESSRLSMLRRLVRLAYRESRALLSLHRQYEKVLARTVISNDTESAVSDLYGECYHLECQLRVNAIRFFEYSKEIPDPWTMIHDYHAMYRHFLQVCDTCNLPLKEIQDVLRK